MTAGRFFLWLGGTDEKVLSRVPAERARATALGGIVLSTAVIATFSMSVAMRSALGYPSLLSLVPALGWGLIVLNLDRWLVSSATGTRWRNRVAILLPRLAVSIVLGVVIAEPIVLRVFETAVEQRVRDDRLAALASYESDLLTCNGLAGAPDAAASARCAPLRVDSGVASPAALRSELDRLRAQKAALDRQIERDSRELVRLNDLARRECNGSPGPGLTGVSGEGPNCDRNRAEADRFQRDHIDGPVRTRDDLVPRIQRLDAQLTGASGVSEQALRDRIAAKVDERRSHQGEIGMLERFQALDALVDEHRFLWAARWFLTAFFILVDCLPVLVKLLSGSSPYERMVEERLAGDVEVFTERSRAVTDRKVGRARTKRYRVESAARLERTRVDDEGRIASARLKADLDAAVAARTAQLLDQARIGPATEPAGDASTSMNGNGPEPVGR
jgi:hypothetical protein